ncbi:MAG TPA: DUF6733 family protein [Chitinophagaceae bacterium]|nr:DUF6733 family protein [Chitinophagaceae bacterium]
MRYGIIILLVFTFSSSSCSAQKDSEENDRSTFTIQLNQDNTFNFFPAVYGSIPVKKIDLTFYAVYWTTPSFANPDGTGSLIETGVGLGFTKESLYINPTLGFAHGTFTNARDSNDQAEPLLADAVVPGLISFLKNEKWEIEVFCAVYQNLRKAVSPQSNYLFFWLLPGIRFKSVFATGLHYEQFRDIKNGIGTYTRYGLYGKVTFKKKYELRLSGGLNYTPGINDKKIRGEFYKLTVNIPF